MKQLKLAMVIFLALAASSTLEAKKVNLKYNLEKGVEYTFESNMNQEISQEVMDQVQEITSNALVLAKIKVLDIDPEGNFRMERSFLRIKMTSGSAMGDMEIDSETIGVDNPFGEFVSLILDNPVTFLMSTTGEILEVSSSENVSEKLTELMASVGAEAQLFGSMAAQFSSEEGIKQGLNAFFLAFPEKKVKVGKPWKTESSINQMVNFVSTINTTVTTLDGDRALLDQVVQIEVGEGDTVTEVEGMAIEYDLTGGKNGTLDLNITSGILNKAESVTTITGMISIDSPQLPAPMSIPMTIKSTESVVRIK